MSSETLCISPHPSSKPIANSLQAVQFIRTLRGGFHPSLMRASDGALYVVKFADCPRGLEMRANEVMGHELLKAVGLPTPAWSPIHVPSSLREERASAMQAPPGPPRPQGCLHFASRFLANDPDVWICDFLPSAHCARLGNKDDFLGMFLFDLLCENAVRRKCVYVADRNGRSYRAVFIGNGHLFGEPGVNGASAGTAGPPPFVNPQKWTDREVDPWIDRMAAGIAAGLRSLDRHPAKLWYKGTLDQARDRLTARLADLHNLFWTELASKSRPSGKERIHASNARLPLHDPELLPQRNGPVRRSRGAAV